ncbi:MAG: YfhO family protein [Clostridiaceae bacterium]|nr:YfhO family protein [Clostridiaceae bacterium]
MIDSAASSVVSSGSTTPIEPLPLNRHTPNRPTAGRFALLAGLLAFVAALLTFLPFMLQNDGRLQVRSDWNEQQIPFNVITGRILRDGSFPWAMTVDLGSSLIGLMSFYTLGTPYALIGFLFPPEFFPWVIGPLLALKYAVAAAGATFWISRYVRRGETALWAGLLYAFSGFSTINIMFNHFHDVISLFPLLLITMDDLLDRGKKGAFALAVALNALTSYFFFIGEVVFLVLYFLTRAGLPRLQQLVGKARRREALSEPKTPLWRRFFHVLGEGVLGVMMSLWLLLPSLLWTTQNPRVGHGLSGAWFCNINRFLGNLKGLLLPADFFWGDTTAIKGYYTSQSLWLPLIGLSLAAVYLLCRPRRWPSALFIICIIMLFVPKLNGLFYAGTVNHYARWLYMPTLIAALMSAKVVDLALDKRLRTGVAVGTIGFCFIFTGSFILFLTLAPRTILKDIYPDARPHETLVDRPELFTIFALITLIGLILTGLFIYFLGRPNERTRRRIFIILCALSLGTGMFLTAANIHDARTTYPRQYPDSAYHITNETGTVARNWAAAKARNEGKRLPEDAIFPYRFREIDASANACLYAKLPTVNTFISTVSGSIFEFYSTIGMNRQIISYNDLPVLDSLLSVRYALSYNLIERPGFSLIHSETTRRGQVYIYENHNALPIGFTYDYYISSEDLFALPPKEKRAVALLQAVLLSDTDNQNKILNSNLMRERLEPLPNYLRDSAKESPEVAIQTATIDHLRESSTDFEQNGRGFSFKIRADRPKIALVSVAADPGWSVKVNGIPQPIIKSAGLMAVPVEAGENTVEFTYTTPGLTLGLIVTLIGILIWLILRLLDLRRRQKDAAKITASS